MQFNQLNALYHRPLFDLISESRAIHLEHWRGEEVQRCSLLSIKTGGCSEDCAYCAQSSHYSTGIEREELLAKDQILSIAQRARAQGATRFCMGAAWRGVRDGTEKFERVLETIRAVSQLGMEVCVTLGEIGAVEARKLKAAGVTAYNHNIDTAPEHYGAIISTRSFSERLDTLAGDRDEYRIVGGEIYLHCPVNYGETKLSNTAIEKVLGVGATTRNWKTVTCD